MALATDLIYITTAIEGQLSSCSECSSPSSSSDQEENSRRSWKWKKLMKKVIEGSRKSIYGSSKPLKFQYNAVSYALNFDEGNQCDEYYSYRSRCSQVLSECYYTTIAIEGRSSGFSECSSPSSVSDHEEYSRRSWKWKKLMKKVIEGSRKSIYGSSKPLKFRYDAVSYALNFDEGNHCDEYYSYRSRRSQVLSEC
ncbi:hypothetical protein L1987_66212 [Smallanthus sonchifolius]|uniref:Uncharacterized protein n=1 Tax=Smallanthus sonchifolius TaxID=185202 RepID=A0ACB9BWR5_9ASTR|nr:hypothetical protein L1987_66212 [Smallanthus sonchifolius]